MIHIPEQSDDLIELLNKHIPERCPSEEETDREIWKYAGKRDLVRELLASLKRADRVQQKLRGAP